MRFIRETPTWGHGDGAGGLESRQAVKRVGSSPKREGSKGGWWTVVARGAVEEKLVALKQVPEAKSRVGRGRRRPGQRAQCPRRAVTVPTCHRFQGQQ